LFQPVLAFLGPSLHEQAVKSKSGQFCGIEAVLPRAAGAFIVSERF
jgi:hypothetical protein